MRLRSGANTGKVKRVTKSYKLKKVPGWAYPKQRRDMSHARKGMPDRDTERYFSKDPGKQAKILKQATYFSVSSKKGPRKFYRVGRSGLPRLKALGVSRNHILADSQVAVLLRTALESGGKLVSKVRANPRPMTNFVRTLAGSNANMGEQALNRVLAGENEIDYLVNMVSMGDGNVRIGDAVRNEQISAGFDEETDSRGYPTERSANVRGALHGLLEYSKPLNYLEPPDKDWADLVFFAGGHVLAPQDPNRTWFKPVTSSDVSGLDQQEPDSFKPPPTQRQRSSSVP